MNIVNADGVYLRHTGPCTQCDDGPFKPVPSFDDLLEYTAHYPLHMSMPFTLNLEYFVDNKITDNYRILVGDRLIYPKDVEDFLLDQYKKTFNFDIKKMKNEPIMLDGIPRHSCVVWHYLGKNDIFVQRKTLIQLWQQNENLGKVPPGLREFYDRSRR